MFLQVTVCPQEGAIPACIAGGIPACLAVFLQGPASDLGDVCFWGGSPGPQPRGQLRGIWSRPTAEGEIEGDLVQAHSQGGSSGNQKQTPPRQTATAADGTHPTGIHSCFVNMFVQPRSGERKLIAT